MSLDSQTITLESLGEDLIPSSVETSPAPATALGNSGSVGLTTGVEERALTLLGSGIAPEAVASALGVTPSRISQLLSNEEFSGKVATLRYENLQEHNLRDGKYDSLEDDLINKLKNSLPLMIKPDTILKAISTINGAKRRGQSSPEQAANHQNIVTLVLPTVIAQQFVTNINNQVTKAGNQELVTIDSSKLLSNAEASRTERLQLEDDNGLDVQEEET